MAICLLLFGLLGLIVLNYSDQNIRYSILKSILVFSVSILGFTEILSLFKSLNYINLVICWSVFDVMLLYFILKKKSFKNIATFRVRLLGVVKSLNSFERFLVGFSVFIIVGVFFQGIIYPTNNWDSMAYHMARIVHWIQNESLEHYRTPVYSQLISPPFAEEVILNVNLLFRGDFFSNCVQLFYLIGTIISVSLVAKELGLNRFGQILSSFILICIPEVILLGSSTHTELVLSFFMVSSIYFIIKNLKRQSFNSFLFLGLALGLSTATKSTAYLYLSPFVLTWILLSLYRNWKNPIGLRLVYSIVVIVGFVLVNSGHYSRNYTLTSSVIGISSDIKNIYVNEEFSLEVTASNLIRNVSSQFGVPKVAPVAKSAAVGFHDFIGEDINNSKTTYSNFEIDPLATHENNGANPYHTILMILSSVWIMICFRKIDKRVLLLWIVTMVSFLLFCFYLKWQPWVKLHAPFFVFYSVVMAHFLISVIKKEFVHYVIVLGFMLNALLILLFNYSRPFISLPPYTSEININDQRSAKYYSRFVEYQSDYENILEQLKARKFKNIGLLFGVYDMEYQLFRDVYTSDINPVHINACSISESITELSPVDCVVSTMEKDVIEYNGENYYNTTKEGDGYLYLFLKK